MNLTRRQVILGMAGTVAGVWKLGASDKWGRTLPQRRLGTTNEQVTCLALGGFHIGWTTEDLAKATIEAAIEEGVRFFDTAPSYSTSEGRFGRYLTPEYREQIFLMTKSQAKTAAEAQAELEQSLDRMGTNRIDLWQLHAVQTPEDADARIDAGVVDFAIEARRRGLIRHIGFTGHASPYALLRVLERFRQSNPFTACQFPVNPVDAGVKHSFTGTVLPAAVEAGLAPLAMKSLADGRFFAEKRVLDRVPWRSEHPLVPGAMSVREATWFALSLPVATLVVGCENPEFLRQRTAEVRELATLGEEARASLTRRALEQPEAAQTEYYKFKDLRG